MPKAKKGLPALSKHKGHPPDPRWKNSGDKIRNFLDFHPVFEICIVTRATFMKAGDVLSVLFKLHIRFPSLRVHPPFKKTSDLLPLLLANGFTFRATRLQKGCCTKSIGRFVAELRSFILINQHFSTRERKEHSALVWRQFSLIVEQVSSYIYTSNSEI